jgi:hypothetical protein
LLVSQIVDDGLNRIIAWIFYYLGVTDGMSASLEIFKTPNPESPIDAEWQTKLRSYLPPELAALRHPNANKESAARVIEQEFMEVMQKTKRQHHKKTDQGRVLGQTLT